MKWKQISGILLISTASISCLCAIYLFGLLLRVRWQTKHRLSEQSQTLFGFERKATYTQHKTLLEFIIRMSFFILIVSFSTLIEVISDNYDFIPDSCTTNWKHCVNVVCWILRFLTTFSIIASISWYFMMTVAIFISLMHRHTILHNKSTFIKYQMIVIVTSFSISILQIVIAIMNKDLQFNGGLVTYFIFLLNISKIWNRLFIQVYFYC